MDALEAAVAKLIEVARGRSPWEYWHAHGDEKMRLVREADRAATLLAPALADSSPAVRRFVARLLRTISRPQPLRTLLADPDDEVRLEACEGLLGEPLPPPSMDVPLVVDEEVRRVVLESLHTVVATKKYVMDDALRICVRLRDPDFGAFVESRLHALKWRDDVFRWLRYAADGATRLLRFTRDPDPELRWMACLQFVHSPPRDVADDDVRNALVERLDDVDRVEKFAVMALRNYPDAALEPRILGMLPRDEAVETLAHWRSEAALPAILDLARAGNHGAIKNLVHYPMNAAIERAWMDALASDTDDFHKYVAADLVSQHGSSTAIPALERYLANDVKQLSKRWRKDAKRFPARIVTMRERPPLP